jgi:acyl carrier protein
MVSLTTYAPRSVARQVLLLISQRTTIPVKRLRRRFHLSRELYLDLLDIVDIIRELEHRFHIHIPDEVPLITIGDLVDYVVAETWSHIRR